MSWLSISFGLLLFTFLLTIWAVNPRWQSMAYDVAKEMNVTDELRVREAWKSAISVGMQLEHYFHRKLDKDKKTGALGVLDSAYTDAIVCIRSYYEGHQMERFKDCIRHVLELHMARLQSHSDKFYGVRSSGASRLQIWH
ncbi:uncharacterized protein LOC108135737 [Drosophila elegans]|uniref:uncharacterized protein LOC108135737 n=1 Tax=Drosophila elegans TaxID=30023 RepID=UPI0007E89397|nr:uncharacterized protein LOC108135737 [Drosophila elegans]